MSTRRQEPKGVRVLQEYLAETRAVADGVSRYKMKTRELRPREHQACLNLKGERALRNRR
jgi:hypothetical protein